MKYFFGFTQIELLMVMAIIGLLASFGVMTYPGVQKSARDAQRRSDLKQYHTALESFANGTGGFYPSRLVAQSANSTICSDINLTRCPKDSKADQYVCATGICNYYYISNGTGYGNKNATRFVLYCRLEKKVDTQEVYFVLCSDGRSGTKAVADWTPASTCPL